MLLLVGTPRSFGSFFFFFWLLLGSLKHSLTNSCSFLFLCFESCVGSSFFLCFLYWLTISPAFITGLRPSGGGDIEEDIAGAFTEAATLMRQRTKPSMKMVVLIADAANHGYPGESPLMCLVQSTIHHCHLYLHKIHSWPFLFFVFFFFTFSFSFFAVQHKQHCKVDVRIIKVLIKKKS